MRKIKILVDARCVGGEGQGVLTYIKGMYNALYHLYADKYELFFAGYNEKEMKAAFPFMQSEHFIELPKTNKLQLFLIVFPRIEREHNIDFSHFQYMTPFRKKSKHIVTTHDVLFLDYTEEFSLRYRLIRKFLFKFALLRSDIRLTVSNYSKQRIAHLFNIPQQTIGITPNAVRQDFFKYFDKESVQKEIKEKYGISNYILYVSRIEKRKNQFLLLESYEELELAKRNIHLVLVGNDTLGETEIPKEIKRLQAKYPGKVHWLNYLDESDLMKFYQAARLFVYPSLAEGFGIPPIEAAALGIETLCSDRTAMKDFSFFGKNLFNPKRRMEFKWKLLDALKETPNDMINYKYRKVIQSKYSWGNAAHILHQAIWSRA